MSVTVGRDLSHRSRHDDRATLRKGLRDGAELLGIAIDEPQTDRLLDYLGLLVRWNRVYNLTAVRDPADMLAVHLLDSLSVLPLLSATGATTILDVGTGPGLPGIPLAICMPRTTFDLVDAVAKKVAFLQQVKSTLTLANIRTHHRRVEVLTLSEMPDAIVSRAYADIATMLASVDHLVGPTTTVVAMKGARPADEIARLPAGWEAIDVIDLDVPTLGAQRCAVVLRRATGA